MYMYFPPLPLSLSLSLMEAGTSEAEVLRSEGTALLHADFALKQNQVMYMYMYLRACIYLK